MHSCLEKKLALSGRIHTYSCELVSLKDGVGILRYVIDREYDIAGFRLSPGDVTLALFWENRPYTVYIWFRKKENDRAYYFNIADSVSLRADEFVWRDLAVDILVDPEGLVHVLDEHELPPDLPADLSKYIEQARGRVLAQFRDIIKEADTLLRAEYNGSKRSACGVTLMNILIVGLGALGTVFATLLQKAGHNVHALTRDRYLDALRDRKVHVAGIWGSHEAVLAGIASSLDPFKGTTFDLVILTVKSYDTGAAIEQVKPLVTGETLVLVAQNGYGNYETVAAAVGREHALLGRIIFGVKLQGTGRAEVTVIADSVRLGQPDGAVPEARCREMAGAINGAGIPTEYAGNITAILWDKILYNAALNPLGAILECTYGQLAEDADTRSLMDAVIEEIFEVARGRGIPLNWKSASDYRDHFYAKLVPATAKHFPSMYYDVKAGKRLEIDALNGAIVRLGREKGIAVPVNEAITRLVKAKEALAMGKKI